MTGSFNNSDGSLRWAEERFIRALGTFSLFSPVKSLENTTQGDILASASGNFRLVLNISRAQGGTKVAFLSLLRSGNLVLEAARLHEISAQKLAAVVKRQAGNPLERFSSIAKNLNNEKVIFQNVQVLLKCGIIGGEITRTINTLKGSGDNFAYIDFWVSKISGVIESVGPTPPSSIPATPISLMYNLLDDPADEYIKNARFDMGCNTELKNNVLAACVIANTIANARNLLVLARKLGKA